MWNKLAMFWWGSQKLVDQAWDAVTQLLEWAEQTHQSAMSLLNQPYYLKVGTALGRVFCLAVFLSNGVVAPEEVMAREGHPKAVFVQRFLTGLHSVPFAYAYLVSFPKNSERLQRVRWVTDLGPKGA
jgi:hypothetical protein